MRDVHALYAIIPVKRTKTFGTKTRKYNNLRFIFHGLYSKKTYGLLMRELDRGNTTWAGLKKSMRLPWVIASPEMDPDGNSITGFVEQMLGPKTYSKVARKLRTYEDYRRLIGMSFIIHSKTVNKQSDITSIAPLPEGVRPLPALRDILPIPPMLYNVAAPKAEHEDALAALLSDEPSNIIEFSPDMTLGSDLTDADIDVMAHNFTDSTSACI